MCGASWGASWVRAWVRATRRGRLPVMGTDYPEHLLAREPAPPYEREGLIEQVVIDDLVS